MHIINELLIWIEGKLSFFVNKKDLEGNLGWFRLHIDWHTFTRCNYNLPGAHVYVRFKRASLSEMLSLSYSGGDWPALRTNITI